MNEKITSLTLVTGDYPAPGHMMMVFVQQLVHAMIDEGVNVSVVASQSLVHALIHRENLLPKHSKGVTEKGVEYDIYRPYTISFGNNNPFEGLTNKYNSRKLRKIINRIGSNVVYSHFWTSAQKVYEYATETHTPLFVACGEGDNAIEDLVRTMPKKELKRMADAVTGVISVSSENKRKCIDFGLSQEEEIEVFPNCVNTNIFRKMDVKALKKELGITKNDFVISFVGGFIPRKGPDRIAKAIKILNDPRIKVIFIGRPFKGYPYDFDCPGVIHKGPLDHELIPQYVNCSDVFIMPTQKEGCCNAIVEALAMGIPVISSDRPFNDDILDEKNSIRLNPDNVNAIASAIARLRDDRTIRQSMSDYSLSRHNEYAIQGRAKRILDFINKKCNERLYK